MAPMVSGHYFRLLANPPAANQGYNFANLLRTRRHPRLQERPVKQDDRLFLFVVLSRYIFLAFNTPT
jgi:hypothetical protein